MPHLLIFSAAFSRDFPASWYSYRDRILDALSASGCASVVTADDAPIFSYGIDPVAALARVNAMRPDAGQVIVAQWTAFEFYSSSVVVLGHGVTAESVTGALRSERLLRDHSGELTAQGALMYGYDLDVFTDEELLAALRLARRVPNAVYVAERPMVNDGEGEIDHTRFELLPQFGAPDRGFVVFRPRTPEAEAEVVQSAARNDGVAVLQSDDPVLEDIARFADVGDELALFLDGADGQRRKRVTIGRCHMDDSFVAVYGLGLEAGLPLLFLV